MILKILLGLWLPSDGWLSYGLISVAFTLQSRFFIYLKVFFDFNIFVILVIYYLIALSLSRPVSLCIFSFHFLISFILLNLLVYWYIRVSITEYHFKRSNKFNKSTVVSHILCCYSHRYSSAQWSKFVTDLPSIYLRPSHLLGHRPPGISVLGHPF